MTRYLTVEISQALFTTLARDGRAAGFLALLFSRMEVIAASAAGADAANWQVAWGCDTSDLPAEARMAVDASVATVQASRPLADFGTDDALP